MPPLIVWQQYALDIGSTQLQVVINNWTAADLKSGNPSIDFTAPFPIPLPTPNTLPAGTLINIVLGMDTAGNVGFVLFEAFAPGPYPMGAVPIVLEELTLTGGGPVASEYLAPITAFELDIVGPGTPSSTSQEAVLSGEGTITYTASTPLTPLNQLPAKCVATTETTGEWSNSIYGTLPAVTSNTFIQYFGTATAKAGMRPRRVTHALRRPPQAS
jgi:hypothetical protein